MRIFMAALCLATSCSGTFGAAPPPPSGAEAPEPVVPPDFDELELVELRWDSPDPDAGSLSGVLPTREVISARVVLRRDDDRTNRDEPGVVDRGHEQGADLFGPFPERWPDRTNTVLRPSRSTRVDLTMATDKGRVFDCRVLLKDLDRGFLGGGKGVCEHPDEERYAIIVVR